MGHWGSPSWAASCPPTTPATCLAPPAGVPVPTGADQGLGASLAVAAHLPAPAGQTFATAARESYIQAMDNTVLVAAAVAFAGALVALRWMPRRTALEPTQPAQSTVHGVEPRSVEIAAQS